LCPRNSQIWGQFSPRKNLSTIKQQRGFFTLKIGSPARPWPEAIGTSSDIKSSVGLGHPARRARLLASQISVGQRPFPPIRRRNLASSPPDFANEKAHRKSNGPFPTGSPARPWPEAIGTSSDIKSSVGLGLQPPEAASDRPICCRA